MSVSYTKQTWTDGATGGTPLSAARLGHLEDGVAAVDAAAAAALQRANHTGTQPASTITGLATVATSGSYTDLSSTPAFPAAQVVHSTVTAGAAATINAHTPVDATAGPVTLTLPTGQPQGTVISVEKEDASANAVTITGNIRAVGGSSIQLVWQYESVTFIAATAGSWWPRAGHKTKASLDAAYSNVTVDGTHTNTLAIDSTDLRGAANGIATLGSDSKVPFTQLPYGAGDTWMGFAATVMFPQVNAGTTTAGRLWFTRVTRGNKAAASKVGFHLNTSSSGSIMVGVYRSSGTGMAAVPGTLAATSGAPQTLTSLFGSSTGYLEVPLTAATDVKQGDYLALWVSDATMGVGYMGSSIAWNVAAMAGYTDVVGAAGTALPASAGTVTGHSRLLYMVAA